MGRFIGLDIHRDFAQVAVVEDGCVTDWGRVGCRPEALRGFATRLRPDDQVALEATGNASAVAVLLEPHVAKVVISNPVKTRAIAEAKVKTDRVDARILAQLLAADFLPGTWLPDERTRMLRRTGRSWCAAVFGSRTRSRRCCTAICCHARRSATCSAPVGEAGSHTRRCRQTSARRSPRCCANSTSTGRSSPRWNGGWPPRRSTTRS